MRQMRLRLRRTLVHTSFLRFVFGSLSVALLNFLLNSVCMPRERARQMCENASAQYQQEAIPAKDNDLRGASRCELGFPSGRIRGEAIGGKQRGLSGHRTQILLHRRAVEVTRRLVLSAWSHTSLGQFRREN